MIVSKTNKKNMLLAYLFILTNLVFSQDVEFKNLNFKEDKQGLKLAKENLEIAVPFSFATTLEQCLKTIIKRLVE